MSNSFAHANGSPSGSATEPIVASDSIGPVTSGVTVTTQVASLPLFDVTVMVAVPSPTAVTTPSATVATSSSLVVQVTVLSVALVGSNVTANVSVAPTVNVNSAGSTLIALTSTSGSSSAL